jgi:hypothetical protein
VQWLEDQFIRFYPIEDRQSLRSENINEWTKAFEKVGLSAHLDLIKSISIFQYLTDLSCPFSPADTDRLALLDWLLAQAISLEYTDNGS